MRFKNIKEAISFLFFIFFTQTSEARMVANLRAPATAHAYGENNYTLYLAGNGTGTLAAGFLDQRYIYPLGSGGTNIVNTTQLPAAAFTNAANQLIWIDVISDKAYPRPSDAASNAELVVTLYAGSNVSDIIPIRAVSNTGGTPVTCVNTSICNGTAVTSPGTDRTYQSVDYTPGNTLRVAFNTDEICHAASGEEICSNPSNTTSSMSVVAVIDWNSGANVYAPYTPSSNGDSVSFTLSVTDLDPTLANNEVSNCPNEVGYYFPGDSEIKLRTGNFVPSAADGVPVRDVIFFATAGTGGVPGDYTAFSSPIVAGVSATGSYHYVKGFTNSSTGTTSDHPYSGSVHSENEAGIVSDLSCDTVPYFYIYSQPISGVLNKGKCFIASAAFQDSEAPPVQMLRHFRETILSKFKLGKIFIKNYYRYSPPLAEWAWNKPVIRSLALHFLAPIELWAWVSLKVFGWMEDTQAEEDPQPYIESLKKKENLQPEDSLKSYTDEQKAKLKNEPTESAPEDSAGYSEKLKKNILEPDTSANYSETARSKLPPEKERESPIKTVKEGREKPLGLPEFPPAENLFSFKLGAVPGISVVAPGQGQPFDYVYGTKWMPDVLFHYEKPYFKSAMGALGLGVDFGLTYSGGYGRLAFSFNGSRKSEVPFSFFQVPLIADAYYRFNFMKYVRPYVGAGLGTMLYSEVRHDDHPNYSGYSLIYTGNIGVALMIDFLDPDTHRDAYLSSGFQHVYLFAEYCYLNTLTTDVVFMREGLYGGVMYEF